MAAQYGRFARGGQVQNVRNALRVLEALGELRVAGVSALARELDLPKTTVQRALQTLHDAGWIKPVTLGARPGWELTAKAARVARKAGAGDALRDAALPVMHELHEATRETVHLLVRDGNEVVLVERIESGHPVQIATRIGSPTPMFASATGKAILAFLPPDEVDAVLAAGMPKLTATTITDPRAMHEHLSEVRARGYAINNGEWWDGLAAVGAPVLDADGLPIAALSVSAPADRLPPEARPEIGSIVAKAARQISLNLGYRPTRIAAG